MLLDLIDTAIPYIERAYILSDDEDQEVAEWLKKVTRQKRKIK